MALDAEQLGLPADAMLELGEVTAGRHETQSASSGRLTIRARLPSQDVEVWHVRKP